MWIAVTYDEAMDRECLDERTLLRLMHGDLAEEVFSIVLMAGLPLAGGSLMLWRGLRRPTSGVALIITGLSIAIIGGIVAVVSLATLGGEKNPGANVALGLIGGIAPLTEGLLLVLRAVRDLKAAARAALLASVSAEQISPLGPPRFPASQGEVGASTARSLVRSVPPAPVAAALAQTRVDTRREGR